MDNLAENNTNQSLDCKLSESFLELNQQIMYQYEKNERKVLPLWNEWDALVNGFAPYQKRANGHC